MLHLYLDVCSKPLGTFLSSLCQILKHENVGLFQLTAFPLHFQRKCLVKVLHQTLDVNTFKPLTFNGNRPITVARKAAWKWMHVLSLFFFYVLQWIRAHKHTEQVSEISCGCVQYADRHTIGMPLSCIYEQCLLPSLSDTIFLWMISV